MFWVYFQKSESEIFFKKFEESLILQFFLKSQVNWKKIEIQNIDNLNAQYKPYFISYHENKRGAVITICYRELCIVTKALWKIKMVSFFG